MLFKVGDTVQLKSGGPDMTVTRIGTSGGDPMVWCAWFEGTKDAYGLFPPDALKAPSPSERAEAIRAPSEPQPNVPLEPESMAAPEPEQARSEWELTKVDKAQPNPGRQPTKEPELTESDAAPAAPGAVHQGLHPTRADSGPRPKKTDKSLEDQIASMRSLIGGWLKR